MTSESNEAEAWYKKPRKIIHNQKLILTFLSLLLPASFSIITLILWATFIFPETILIILTAWGITTISYLIILILRKTCKKT